MKLAGPTTGRGHVVLYFSAHPPTCHCCPHVCLWLKFSESAGALARPSHANRSSRWVHSGQQRNTLRAQVLRALSPKRQNKHKCMVDFALIRCMSKGFSCFSMVSGWPPPLLVFKFFLFSCPGPVARPVFHIFCLCFTMFSCFSCFSCFFLVPG